MPCVSKAWNTFLYKPDLQSHTIPCPCQHLVSINRTNRGPCFGSPQKTFSFKRSQWSLFILIHGELFSYIQQSILSCISSFCLPFSSLPFLCSPVIWFHIISVREFSRQPSVYPVMLKTDEDVYLYMSMTGVFLLSPSACHETSCSHYLRVPFPYFVISSQLHVVVRSLSVFHWHDRQL